MNFVEILLLFFIQTWTFPTRYCVLKKNEKQDVLFGEIFHRRKNMFVAGRQGRPKKIRYNQTKSLYVILSEVEVLSKRRLTHRGFLDKYCRVVKTGGEFHYKTDNAPLFEFSVEEFAACGLEVKNLTRDLHANGIVGITTGYEEKFHALGTPINRCEVVCKPFVMPAEEKKEAEEE